MTNQTKDYKKEITDIIFNWRKGFDVVTQENALQAENEFGQFIILWPEGAGDKDFTVVIGDDISGGDQFDTLDEAKDFCLQFVRGILLRNMVTYYIMGVNFGKYHQTKGWNQDHFNMFLDDQFFNGFSPLTVDNVEELIANMKEESLLNGRCSCPKCLSVFGEEDDMLPGDAEAMPDIQDDAPIVKGSGRLKLVINGKEVEPENSIEPDSVFKVDTKKPTIH